MHLEFTIGRNANGQYIRAEFDARLVYEIQPFEYRIGPFRTAENIKEILNQYAAIDTLRTVALTGCTILPIFKPAEPILDATVILFGGGHRVCWSVRRPGAEFPVLQRMILEHLQPSLAPLEIIIAGTVMAVLPELKEQARRQVREAAIRRARVMRDNAIAVLTFLNQPE